jgi:large subunit ribosomal protein L19
MDLGTVVEVTRNPNVEAFAPGDMVKVSVRELGKERVQAFQGIVIRIRKSGAGSSFTVRRSVYGVGVERTFPFYSPLLEKVEIMEGAQVRRAKLYYLRGLSSRAIKAKIKPTRVKTERKKARKG